MNLNLPVVGVTVGPTYATLNNTAFETIDLHDHSSGKGVQIPSAGIGINGDLTFNSFAITSVKLMQLVSQSTTPTETQVIYVDNSNNLYYKNSSSDLVQLTTGDKITRSSLTTLTANRVVVTDGSGNDTASSITTTELDYLSGASSNIQTQITNNDTDISTLDNAAAKTADNETITGTWDFDNPVTHAHNTTPANPASGHNKLYFKSDEKLYKLDSAGNELEVGSGTGSGEVNYIDNSDFESNTNGWATYADAAGTTPVDGTGGSANITISSQASTILRGSKSLQMTKDAANRQGEGFSYDFTIKEQDVSKKLKIQFDFKTNEDTTYTNGDLAVYIYDVTNSILITPSDTDIISGQNIFQTSFNSTTSTSYRLIFHIATTNASAYDIYIDDVIVGPGMTSQGAAIGPTYSQTLDNTNFANDTGLTIGGRATWQRIGDEYHFDILMFFSGTGSDASALQFQPTTLTDFPNVTFVSGHYGSGIHRVDDNTAGDRQPATAIYSTDGTSNIMFAVNQAGADLLGNQYGSTGTLFDQLSISGKISVTEYQGKGIVPMLAEDNLSEWQTYTPTTQGFGTISADNVQYRRLGDTMEIKGDFTAGTTDTNEAQVGLPSGFTIAQDTANTLIAGDWVRDTPTNEKYFTLSTNGDTYFNISRLSTGGADNPTTPGNGQLAASTGNRVSFNAKVQIAEWAGSQNSLVGYSLANDNQAGLLNFYKTETVSVDNNYTSGSFTVTRVGNQVTLTGNDTWAHSSATSASTSAGILPIDYRPSDTLSFAYYLAGAIACRLRIETDGTITTSYFDGNLTAKNETGSVVPPAATYVIT